MTEPSTTDSAPWAEWCIVEQLGHRRLAGHLQEVQLAGHGFFRLDIPAVGPDPGRTQYLSPASIYSFHPVTEEVARAMATMWRPAPVQRWELPAAPSAPATQQHDRDEDNDDEGEDPFL